MSERALKGVEVLRQVIRWHPVAWVLGLGGVFALVGSLWAALVSVRGTREPARLGPGVVALGLFVLLYVAALTAAVITREHDMSRVIASTYNLALWLGGIATLIVVATEVRGEADAAWLLSAVRDACLLVGVLGVPLTLTWFLGYGELRVPTPLGLLAPGLAGAGMPLVRSMLHPSVVVTDWLFGLPFPRLTLLHPYPNALALAALIGIAAELFLRARTDPARRRWGLDVARLALLAIPLVLTWQRTILVVFVALAAAHAVVRAGDRLTRPVIRALAVAGIIAVAPIVLRSLDAATVLVRDARAGSTASRASAYGDAWALIADRPLAGYGVKVREADRAISVGSHSTYLGTLLKTGVGGLVLVLVWASDVAVRSVRVFFRGGAVGWLGVAGLTIVVWMAVEDIDAPAFASLLAFSLLGIVGALQGPRYERLAQGPQVT